MLSVIFVTMSAISNNRAGKNPNLATLPSHAQCDPTLAGDLQANHDAPLRALRLGGNPSTGKPRNRNQIGNHQAC